MKVLEITLLKALMRLLLPPHRASQFVANAGDIASGEVARLYFQTLRRLGELESRGVR